MSDNNSHSNTQNIDQDTANNIQIKDIKNIKKYDITDTLIEEISSTKKANYTKLKEFEIENDLLAKAVNLQSKINKKLILSGGNELTIKQLINYFLRKGIE